MYENNVTDFFDLDEIFPNEGYRFENISPEFLQEQRSSTPLCVVWNQQYGTFTDIPYRILKISENGILVLIKDLETASL